MILAPGSLPPSLALKVEAVLARALRERPSTSIPVNFLRTRIEHEHPSWQGIGSAIGVIVFLWFALTLGIWFGAVFGIGLGAFIHCAGALALWHRRRNARPSPQITTLAQEAAGFDEIERTAVALGISPRTDDARLVAARDAIAGADAEPIRAERLKLRLALTKAEGDEREALEATLALCERRLEAAEGADALRRRIEAYRGLVLQSLRAAGEGLGRSSLDQTPELARIREASDALVREAGAIEAAVQEAGAL